ncbi:hypothetical protein N431DRAFT_561345 [Stipitochalara longipes BDJ]|nr:hypothetical protein N431DRAFT_561345 [Stipitochalara longipes BDJ]
MASLKIDQWKGRWSFARGATKATHRTKGQSMTELTEALAEVDGLLAGINYQEKAEPDLEEIPSLSPSNNNCNNSPPQNPATASWFGHLAVDLPQLGSLGSEERSKIEPRHLRSILNDKLVNSNDKPRQIPRESQWTTIRSLRKASMLHYNDFAKITADSTNTHIRKLRKSYVTAKKLLEMGVLTFRQVLHGQNPTTLVDIFAFASLSYVISKTLHAKGHIDESDILSGILDWRDAITDERERSAFEDIAGQLWPEAKLIMHFIPLERVTTSPEIAGLRRDENEARYTTSFMSQEVMDGGTLRPGEGNIASREDPPLSPWAHPDASGLQANKFETLCLSEVENPPGGLQNYVRHLTQETKSHPEFTFSDWFNLDSAFLDGFLDPDFYETLAPDIGPEVLDPLRTECVNDTEFASAEPPSCSPDDLAEPSPDEQRDPLAHDSTLHRLLDTPLFQIVVHFMIEISEMGDLLNVLSGGGVMSGKDGRTTSPSRQPWEASEFLVQASKYFLGPLHDEAAQIDGIFSGIVAMAEMFVKLGSLQTVREVENYIITVGRYLVHSSDLFATLVSKTLNQCLFASQKMGGDLLYPDSDQEADGYSTPYVDRRQRGEKKYVASGLARRDLSESMSSLTSSSNENPQKDCPNPRKRPSQERSSPPVKRRRGISGTTPQGSPSGSDASTIEYCPFDNCGKPFTGRAAPSSLSRHVRNKHHKKKSFKCPVCGRVMNRRDNLRQHFMTMHDNHILPDWLADKRRGLHDARRIS